ncbi:MAG TPA: VTT domain-containing protein [Verrucomicrobiae bacterium]
MRSRQWLPLVLFLLVSLYVYSRFDWREIQQWLAHCNGLLVFVLILLLPIFGFPVSVLQILAGAKFGIGLGFLLSTLSIFVHLLAMYWVGRRALRRPIDWLLRRHNHHLPQVPGSEERSAAFLMTLLPGSYALKNYVMVLGGVSLRTLLWICAPVYALRAIFGIYFGHFSAQPSGLKTAILIGNTVLITAISAYLVKRLRERWVVTHSKQQSQEPFARNDNSEISGK